LTVSDLTPFFLSQVPRAQLSLLRLSGVFVAPDFDALKFMEGFNPTNLILVSVALINNDPKYMLKFIELVLRCRKLNEFGMKVMYEHSCNQRWGRAKFAEGTEIGLQLWLENLRAEGPANHSCLEFHMSDVRDLPDEMKLTLFERNFRTMAEEYIEAPLAVDMDYMYLTSRAVLTDTERREQPFHIPRNSESYTIWVNPKTNMYRVTGNTKPYTQRVKDIQQRIRIRSMFVFDAGIDQNKIKFQPVDVSDLKLNR